ncbi:unnamed protein product, partial [Lymnaea stagnalis]
MAEWSSVEKPHSFICDYATESISSIVWKKNEASYFSCFAYNMPTCVPADENSSLYYEANLTSNAASYTSVFTIKSVQLVHHNTIWICQPDLTTASAKQYNLYVFAPAKTPRCDSVTLLNDTNIEIHCYTDIVFPLAVCGFYVNTNATREVKLTNGSISYISQPSLTKGYNRTDCTYTISAYVLGSGTHLFSVEMYPNITSNITDEIKSRGQYNDPTMIGYPQAHLEDDCFVYIKEKENRTCTCTDVSKSILRSKITWSAEHEIMNIETNRTLIRSISLFEGQSFTCTIRNTMNLTNRINYILKRNYKLPDTDTEVNFIALGAGVGAGLLLLVATLVFCFVFQKEDLCLIKTNS